MKIVLHLPKNRTKNGTTNKRKTKKGGDNRGREAKRGKKEKVFRQNEEKIQKHNQRRGLFSLNPFSECKKFNTNIR